MGDYFDLGTYSRPVTTTRASQHPDYVWSLHGYVECLTRQGKLPQAATIPGRLNLALARADVPINASCYCCE